MAENIILFPNFEEKLLQKVNQLMKAAEYQAAADILEEMIQHEANHFDLNSRLLQCYIHLNETKSGLSLVETLLEQEDTPHYGDYFQYYLVMLTEQMKFMKIIREIDAHRNLLNAIDASVFEQYYLYAKSQVDVQTAELLSDIKDHIKRHQLKTVFRILFKWETLELDIPNDFETYINEALHPILKTKILLLMKARRYDKALTVQKFDQVMVFNGKELQDINIKAYGGPAFSEIESIENDNPTLYQLVLELLHQYLYVIYPFRNSEAELIEISTQIIEIAKFNLGMQSELIPNGLADEIVYKLKLYEEII